MRARTIDALFIQAGIAAALSFSHIHDVAVACGQGQWQAWAYPISVDLLLFAAWRRLRKGEGGKQEWVWFCVALVASLGANLATAGLMTGEPPAWLSLIVAGWPALAFLGGTLLVHKSSKAEGEQSEGTEVPQADPIDELAALRERRTVPAADVLPPANVVDLPVNVWLPEAPQDRPFPQPETPKKSRAEAAEIIEMAWKNGVSVEDAAKAATRHPVSVRRQYAKLDAQHAAKKESVSA